ncbi:MAG: hypothetical protein IPM97_07135 [Bdellovibrionaceae bacterium]|nr:hypothetical protein [Pseudobdellovibrionaceae bacterium]
MKLTSYLAVIGFFLFIGCSSSNRYEYYKSFPEENSAPKVTQEPEHVALTYKMTRRSIFQNDFQQRVWIKISNFSRSLYTVGPVFLPIIPAVPASLWGDSPILDRSKKIEISLSAYSDPIFNEKIVELPDLIIETPDGRVLSAKAINDGGLGTNMKSFTYDTTVLNTPWFILRSAEIKLDNGKVIKIPRLKFVMTSEFLINWNEPIAP